LLQTEVQAQNQGKSHDDEQNDEEGPPLEFACSPCMVNTLCKLYIRLLCVFDDVLGLFFSGLYSGFLDDDSLGEILEELVEFLESSFDLHDVVVASADSAEYGGCGASSVGFELLVIC
jgi:hypothetical protein